MKKIKTGIIGTGGIANLAHLPALQNIPDVELIAACDIKEEALQTSADKYDVKHRFFDYKKLLEMDEIQAVHICTPNIAHAPIAIDCLKAGKHVLVEKPVARNVAEATAILEASKKSTAKIMVAQCIRFASEAQCLKRFIDAGDLGEIYFSRVWALRRRGIPGWGVFTDKEKQGGGPLIDIGVHILDLTLWLMGHPKPIAASGQTYAKFGHRDDVVGFMGQWDYKKFTVEDFAAALIRFDNGATIILESSFAANLKEDVYNSTLCGTEGGAETNPPRIIQEKHRSLVSYTPDFPGGNVNTHHAEVKSFIECIKKGEKPLVTGEQGMMVAQIMDAIYASSEAGKEVSIA